MVEALLSHFVNGPTDEIESRLSFQRDLRVTACVQNARLPSARHQAGMVATAQHTAASVSLFIPSFAYRRRSGMRQLALGLPRAPSQGHGFISPRSCAPGGAGRLRGRRRSDSAILPPPSRRRAAVPRRRRPSSSADTRGGGGFGTAAIRPYPSPPPVAALAAAAAACANCRPHPRPAAASAPPPRAAGTRLPLSPAAGPGPGLYRQGRRA